GFGSSRREFRPDENARGSARKMKSGRRTFMRRSAWVVGFALVAIVAINIGVLQRHGASPEAVVAAAPPDSSIAAAGPGLVEPQSEEVRVSAQIGGRLDRVLVDEGERVT